MDRGWMRVSACACVPHDYTYEAPIKNLRIEKEKQNDVRDVDECMLQTTIMKRFVIHCFGFFFPMKCKERCEKKCWTTITNLIPNDKQMSQQAKK